MDTITQAIAKLNRAKEVRMGCMLTADESKALVEAIALWTETKATL